MSDLFETGRIIQSESSKYYANKENVTRKWIDQYSRLSFGDDYQNNKTCVSEVFNLLSTVVENTIQGLEDKSKKLGTYTDKKGQRMAKVIYHNKRIDYSTNKSFFNRIRTLQAFGIEISETIDADTRPFRNMTTHGNQTIVVRYLDMSYSTCFKIMLEMADALVTLGMLDPEDRLPSFERMRVRVGSTLKKDSYTILRLIDEGGMSRVYEASSTQHKQTLAIKEFRADLVSIDDMQKEASILRSLEYERIPVLQDTFYQNGTCYLVMDYIHGVPLDRYLADHTLSFTERTSLCIGICSILSYLHTRKPGIVYADLKPQNLLITYDKKPYLIDFGTARTLDADSTSRETTMAVSGNFTAPEIYAGTSPDILSDLYSLGMVIQAIFQTNPITGHTVNEIYKRINPITLRLTSLDPEDRYANAAAVRTLLEKANAAVRAKKRRRMIAAILAVAAVVGGAVAFPRIQSDLEYKRAISDAAANYSDETIEALYRQAEEYVAAGDTDAFASLFRNAEDTWDEVKRQEKEIQKILNLDYTSTSCVEICHTDNKYLVEIVHGVRNTEDVSPDDYAKGYPFYVSYLNGTWLFDESSECKQAIQPVLDSLYPAEYLDAKEQARNYSEMTDVDGDFDYLWMTDRTFPDFLAIRNDLLWQDADGTVWGYVSIKNGMSEDIPLDKLVLTITDSVKGTIVDSVEVGISKTIPAGASETILVEVPADQLLLNDIVWSAPTYQLEAYYYHPETEKWKRIRSTNRKSLT